MLTVLNKCDKESTHYKWLSEFFVDFRKRFLSLLAFQFSSFHPSLALSIITNNSVPIDSEKSASVLPIHVNVIQFDFFIRLKTTLML